MTPQFIEGFAFETLKLILLVSAPVLLVAMVVGFAVSVLQATTQINEATIGFVPKIVAIYATLILFSGFIMDRLMNFSAGIFGDFSRFVK
ncbi:MAG: flagellar biosynthetic protein FliQ [Deltaproteobacteria bacterium]|nr:flagellar biosynthetic protein FliQ [Deltaproteobacteria bacterium]